MSNVILFCLCLWGLSGVLCEVCKVLLVAEGDHVTLFMSLNDIQRKQGISWKYGARGYLIAEITRTVCKARVYDDQVDGRFKDRLMLDNQTGSLTIMNITTNHSGLYEVSNTSTNAKLNIFNITVYDQQFGYALGLDLRSIIGIGSSSGVIFVSVLVVVLICICRKRTHIYQQNICSEDNKDAYTEFE